MAGGDGECTGVGAGDGGDGGVGEDFDTVAFEFGVHEGAEFGVDGGQNFGQRFDLGDVDAAGGEGFGHLQADVAGTDDHRGGGASRCWRESMTAKVSPMECSRCTPSAGPSASGPLSPRMGGRALMAPVPTIRAS